MSLSYHTISFHSVSYHFTSCILNSLELPAVYTSFHVMLCHVMTWLKYVTYGCKVCNVHNACNVCHVCSVGNVCNVCDVSNVCMYWMYVMYACIHCMYARMFRESVVSSLWVWIVTRSQYCGLRPHGCPLILLKIHNLLVEVEILSLGQSPNRDQMQRREWASTYLV